MPELQELNQSEQPINRLRGYTLHNLLAYSDQTKKLGKHQFVSRAWHNMSLTSMAWSCVRTAYLGTYNIYSTQPDYSTPHTFSHVQPFTPYDPPTLAQKEGLSKYLTDCDTHESVTNVLDLLVGVETLILSGQIPHLIGQWVRTNITTKRYHLKVLSMVVYPKEDLGFWFALLHTIKQNPEFLSRVKLRCHFGFQRDGDITRLNKESSEGKEMLRLFHKVVEYGGELDQIGFAIQDVFEEIVAKLHEVALKGLLLKEYPDEHLTPHQAPGQLIQIVNNLRPHTIRKINWQLDWTGHERFPFEAFFIETFSPLGQLLLMQSAQVSQVRSLQMTGAFNPFVRHAWYDPYYDNCTKILTFMEQILSKMPELSKLELQPGECIPPSFQFDMASFVRVIDCLAEHALNGPGMIVDLQDVVDVTGWETFDSDVAVQLKQLYPEDKYTMKTSFRSELAPGFLEFVILGDYRLELKRIDDGAQLVLHIQSHRHPAPAPQPQLPQEDPDSESDEQDQDVQDDSDSYI